MNESRHCPSCGAPLSSDALEGLCPKCMAKVVFGENAASEGKAGAKPDENVAAEPPADFAIERAGTMIGRYKLLEQIGEGGFGVVYMAEQVEPVQRKVALKVIKAGMDTKEVIARFEAERQALALMDHPNIARILDAGVTGGSAESEIPNLKSQIHGGRPYFVMELVRGIPITEFCDQKRLSTTERLELFMKVCSAVQHAHQKGIIHRDIKPSNVLVTLHDGEPVPKVIDFGVAKALGQKLTEKTLFTGFAHLIGTPAYMSPEQAELSGLDIDTRSDIYSLGVLLYELLTGVTPFDRETLAKAALDEIRRMIREVEPVKPSTRLTQERARSVASGKSGIRNPKSEIDKDLDWIVMKCLEKDRRRRYETANGLAMDIQRHLTDEPIVARPPSKLYEFQKTIRRHKFGFAAAAAIVLVLVVGVVVSTGQAIRATRAERVAETEAARSAQVARFMKEMLEGVGSSVAMGRDTTLLREILDQTARRLDPELSEQPAVQAELLATLGEVYRDIDELDKAVAAQRRALSIRLGLYGDKPHAEVATSLDYLSRALWKHRDVQETETLQRQALAMRQELFGEESLEAATSWYYLGRVIHVAEGNREPEAESALRNALRIRQKLLGDHLDVARVLETLSTSLREQGNIEGAKLTLRAASEMYDRIPDDPPLQGFTVRKTLARILEDEGDLDGAEKLYRESIGGLSGLLGEAHTSVAEVVDYLLRLLARRSKWEEAEKLAREAFAIQQELLGYEHPRVSLALHRLGEALAAQGKLAEAEESWREAIALDDKLNRTGRKDLTQAYWIHSQLGGVLFRQGRYTEAEKQHREAVALRREVGDTRYANSVVNLADALQAQGKVTDAEVLYQEEMSARQKSVGDEDPVLATLQIGFGKLLQTQGKLTEAAALFRKGARYASPDALNGLAWPMATSPITKDRDGPTAVALAEKAVAATGRKNYQIMDTLAAAYAEAGQFTNAVRVQQEAIVLLPSAQTNLAIDFQSRLRLFEFGLPFREYWREANRLEAAGKFIEAEPLLFQELEMRRKIHEPDDPVLAGYLASLAQNLLKNAKFLEAEKYADECLKLREAKLPDNWLTFNARSLLGAALLGQKKYTDETERMLLSGYKGMKERADQIPPAGKVRLKEALERLVQLYEATNRPEQAGAWKQKLAEFENATATAKP